MPFAERAGQRLHYVVSGRAHGTTVLLLNALGASTEMWATQLPSLERRFRVVRCDARGHGKSPSPSGPPDSRTIDDFVDDALVVLDAIGASRVCWCGLSLGGMIAMRAAVRDPQRVAALVLASTTAFFPPAEFWQSRIETARQHGMNPIADGAAERWFTAAFRAGSPEVVARIVDAVRATEPRGYAEGCSAIRDMDQRESLTSISAPTLVIAGAQDVATTIEHAAGLTTRIPRSDLLVLDAAHLCNVEQSDDFTRAVLEFLPA